MLTRERLRLQLPQLLAGSNVLQLAYLAATKTSACSRKFLSALICIHAVIESMLHTKHASVPCTEAVHRIYWKHLKHSSLTLQFHRCRHTLADELRRSPFSQTLTTLNLPIWLHCSAKPALLVSNISVDKPASSAAVRTSCNV